ncbi:MAG: hypothetical protein PHW14_05055 [Candidatus Omnitrophica bacterium]|nr:hypothetical protein [Candidatus Omnitrophota bacterium]
MDAEDTTIFVFYSKNKAPVFMEIRSIHVRDSYFVSKSECEMYGTVDVDNNRAYIVCEKGFPNDLKWITGINQKYTSIFSKDGGTDKISWHGTKLTKIDSD